MTINDTIINRWASNAADGGTRYIPRPQVAKVTVDGDRLLSYGWWEMARILRDKKGAATRFLINGDTYSVTTSRQQSEVRGAIQRSGLPSVIIPFSVLDEAGIVRDSISVLDVSADTMITKTETRTENPGRWDYGPYSSTTRDDSGGWQNTLTGEIVNRADYSARRPATECEHDRPATPFRPFAFGFEGGYDSPEYLTALAEHESADAANKAHTRLHHGEWDEFPASVRGTGHKRIVSGPNGRLDWLMVWDDKSEAVTYQRTTRRHLPGGSLVTATVRYRTSSGGSATRSARFLSGFDEQETRPSYFFCEMPKASKAKTISHAYEDLKPATVKTAEALGREVKRQGDIYAVPLTIDTRTALKGATRTKGAYILGTNHTATEVATLGGLTYIRGTITHAPLGRRPDHKRIAVGKQWHLVLKNTVPVAA